MVTDQKLGDAIYGLFPHYETGKEVSVSIGRWTLRIQVTKEVTGDD